MRVICILASVVIALASPACAQEPTPDQKTQACLSKLLETTQGELNVRALAIMFQTDTNTVRGQLAAAQARIKALEDKYEPKDAKPQ